MNVDMPGRKNARTVKVPDSEEHKFKSESENEPPVGLPLVHLPYAMG